MDNALLKYDLVSEKLLERDSEGFYVASILLEYFFVEFPFNVTYSL